MAGGTFTPTPDPDRLNFLIFRKSSDLGPKGPNGHPNFRLRKFVLKFCAAKFSAARYQRAKRAVGGPLRAAEPLSAAKPRRRKIFSPREKIFEGLRPATMGFAARSANKIFAVSKNFQPERSGPPQAAQRRLSQPQAKRGCCLEAALAGPLGPAEIFPRQRKNLAKSLISQKSWTKNFCPKL